ncbi:butyrate kinase [Bacteroides sp. 519]|uniref:butyrate kinase n=1 Tax=Bacteroides sp. 519 TaxID=2302937 RepID=UPI0013D0CF98|nr:butyrate kinase [Bacteroides sp. 519]NDV57637.1 butyrate kinase [Bacteroides sp. 519]
MKILAINPGSTSTKIAVYEDKESLFESTIRHSVNELSAYTCVSDQFEFRKSLVMDELKRNNVPFLFDAIIGRGGLIKPIPSGVYEVNDALKNDLIHAQREHASNLGGLIALELASELPGCKAFIADPVVVDELADVARISGSPLLPRISIFHALNQKAIARRYAKECGRKYEDLNLVVCHLGGGISVAAHKQGKVIDVNNALDGEGPISPERAGTLPAAQLVNLCFSGEYSKDELLKMITGRAGIAAHLGTTDMIAILKSIENGDKQAELIFNAMIYNVAKAVGSMAAILCGKVDAILFTGGIAYSEHIISCLKEYISFLAPVHVYPGEDELGALATNALGALTGELPVLSYC